MRYWCCGLPHEGRAGIGCRPCRACSLSNRPPRRDGPQSLHCDDDSARRGPLDPERPETCTSLIALRRPRPGPDAACPLGTAFDIGPDANGLLRRRGGRGLGSAARAAGQLRQVPSRAHGGGVRCCRRMCAAWSARRPGAALPRGRADRTAPEHPLPGRGPGPAGPVRSAACGHARAAAGSSHAGLAGLKAVARARTRHTSRHCGRATARPCGPAGARARRGQGRPSVRP